MITIKATNTGIFRDGGTKEYKDQHGIKYFIDFRIHSKTKGKIFDRYPGDDGAQQLENIQLVEKNFVH